MPASYFKGADFKPDIRFRNVLAEIPKFGHFGPKGINSLILAKFCLYSISKVLISNLTFASKMLSPKPQIWAFLDKMHQLSNLNEILPVSYFEGANFKFDIRFLWFLVAQYPGYNDQFNFLRFATYLEKAFSFCKSLKTL